MHNQPDHLHVGVVGCGYWGSKHVRVLSSQPGVTVSVIDADAHRRRDAEASHTIHRSVASLDEVIDELDALVIATPPTSHYALAVTALEHDCHVLVEKPLTTSGAEADALVALAAERDLRLMVGHTFEFNPAVWTLRDTIRDPAFGRVRYIDSARLNLGLYQSDVDVLWDLAPHDISILNFILDDTPTAVSAWGLELMSEQSDVAYLSLRYDKADVSANVHVSWLDPMKVRRTTVVGENQMAVYDDVATEERIRVYDKGVDAGLLTAGQGGGYPLTYRHGDIHSPYIDFKEPLQLEISAFVEAIRSGITTQAGGRSGADVVRVLCAAEQSKREGAWVPVDYTTADYTDLVEPVIDLRDTSTAVVTD
ncbi:MAG: Gfo/Idh/MocA family protein [Acidimicrobiales bacterium]